MNFTVSVWVKEGEIGVRSIDTVDDAIIYLADWPARDRGPLYFVAVNALESAKSGSIPADEAKPELIELLADAGILAEDQMPN
ncbi:DUF982 domain-containing protein [Mesorhizobium sp. CCNWLW179-1]|uniref:DUF982 domain-containing protein n=1 Tax=unclassified Mesorhizobium TaxID=325217 RepID=UPI0030144BE4